MPPTVTTKREPQSASDMMPEQDEALYHFGALPASGLIDYVVSTREKQAATGDFHRIEKVSPWDMWALQNGIEQSRVWLGKCRYFQSLTCKGFLFPAFSEYVEREATNENEQSRIPYPGAVARLNREQVEGILRSCYRHIVRYSNGVKDIMALGHRAEMLDLDRGMKPPGMSDAEWRQYCIEVPTMAPTKFNPRTDKYVAEFVYLVKLSAEPFETPAAEYPMLVGGLTKKFFETPPKSIAEAYPRPAETP